MTTTAESGRRGKADLASAGAASRPVVDRNGLEILDRRACLDLLASVTVGRLAYMSGGLPRVIPLSVALDDEDVLFRLGTGKALAAIESAHFVTLEVDELDPHTRTGWSVTVTGAATEVPAALAAQRARRCCSWLRGTVGRLFLLPTDHIEGRKLHPQVGNPPSSPAVGPHDGSVEVPDAGAPLLARR